MCGMIVLELVGSSFLRKFNSIDYSKLFQNYWWLRSPHTTVRDDVACGVVSSGDVGLINGIVSNSYGRRSPYSSNINSHAYECCVTPSGVVDYHYNHVSLKSYGKDETALIHQILIKYLVVKIADRV